MTAFRVPIPSWLPRWALCIAATHGLTDLRLVEKLWVYGLVLAVPFHETGINIVFFLASMAHFAIDIGSMGSTFLHGALAIACVKQRQDVAIQFLMIYMCFVHVPMHFTRVLCERSLESTLSVTASLAAAWAVNSVLHTNTNPINTINTITLDHISQRIVIAHVIACVRD